MLLNIRIGEVKDGYAGLVMNLEDEHLQFLRTVDGGALVSLPDSTAVCAIVGPSNLKVYSYDR